MECKLLSQSAQAVMCYFMHRHGLVCSGIYYPIGHLFLRRVKMPPLQQTFHWAAMHGGCGSRVDLLLVLQRYSRQSTVFSRTLLKHVLPLEGIRIVSIIIHPTNLINEKQDCIIYSKSVRKKERREKKGTKTRGKKAGR